MVSNNKKKRKNKNKRKDVENANQLDKSTEEQEQAGDEALVTGTEHDLSDDAPRKREHAGDDSDADEEKPRKKKKKKQQVPVDPSDNKKGKKSIRQMKKEKHAQRLAEAQSASKDQLKSQCLNYLSQWKHDKQNWKFMKVKQVWLQKHKFSSNLIPDASWPTLLAYFDSAKGNVRNILLEDANKVIKQMDDWTESLASKGKKDDELDDDEESETPKPDETSYKRARDLIQCLEEYNCCFIYNLIKSTTIFNNNL